MSPADIAAYVRLQCNADATSYPDADLITRINYHQDRLAMRLVEIDEDYFGIPATTDLVANQREYPFPADQIGKMKFIQAQLDGTNWVQLSELDLTQFTRTTDEATITNYFDNTQANAKFDIFRNSIFIYSGSIINVTGGLKLYYTAWPSKISDMTLTTDLSVDPTTTSAGLPRQLHPSLCTLLIRDWKQNQDIPTQLTPAEANVELEIQNALDEMFEVNEDRNYRSTRPYLDGQNY